MHSLANCNAFSLKFPLSYVQMFQKICQQSPEEILIVKDFQNQNAMMVKNSNGMLVFIVPWDWIHNGFHLVERGLEIIQVLYISSKLPVLKAIHSDSVFFLEFVGLHCSQTTLSSDHHHALLEIRRHFAYSVCLLPTRPKLLRLQRHLREWQMTQPSFYSCKLLVLYMANEKKQQQNELKQRSTIYSLS